MLSFFWPVSAVAVCGSLLAGQGLRDHLIPEGQVTLKVAARLAAGGGGRDRAAGPWRDQAVELRAGGYDSAFVRQVIGPLMSRSVAAGNVEGTNTLDLFAAIGGQPGRLLRGELGRGLPRGDRVMSPSGESLSAAFSDYDHSGRESLFVAGAEGVRIFHARHGRAFVDVTREARVGCPPCVLFASIALGDLDGDGFDDFVAAGYADLTRPPAKPLFTFPNDFAGVTSRIYRNNGDGTFTDLTEGSGVGKNPGRARKVILADLNHDQRLDVVFLRDEKPPAFYLNRGGWKFVEFTWEAGADLTTHAFFEGAATDFNRDGKTDFALWSTHSFRILMNHGNARFKRVNSKSMPEPQISLFGFRGVVVDLDEDGFDDVITSDQDGHLRAFANRAGVFREVSLVLPAADKDSYLTAVRWGASLKVRLVALGTDGHLNLLANAKRR